MPYQMFTIISYETAYAPLSVFKVISQLPKGTSSSPFLVHPRDYSLSPSPRCKLPISSRSTTASPDTRPRQSIEDLRKFHCHIGSSDIQIRKSRERQHIHEGNIADILKCKRVKGS